MAGRPGGEGGVAHSDSPRHCVSRVNGIPERGGPEILAGRGPMGGGRTAGLCSPAGKCGGSGEESGDTLSAKRADLKAFMTVDSQRNPIGLHGTLGGQPCGGPPTGVANGCARRRVGRFG